MAGEGKQQKQQQLKKRRSPLWVFGRVAMNPVGEWLSFLFFLSFFLCFLTTLTPLSSTLSDNRKKLYSYSLFHPDSIYSSNNNISENCIPSSIFLICLFIYFFSDLKKPFSTIQKKVKETKKIKEKKTWSQNLPKTYCS